jgi:hypothetical protein
MYNNELNDSSGSQQGENWQEGILLNCFKKHLKKFSKIRNSFAVAITS